MKIKTVVATILFLLVFFALNNLLIAVFLNVDDTQPIHRAHDAAAAQNHSALELIDVVVAATLAGKSRRTPAADSAKTRAQRRHEPTAAPTPPARVAAATTTAPTRNSLARSAPPAPTSAPWNVLHARQSQVQASQHIVHTTTFASDDFLLLDMFVSHNHTQLVLLGEPGLRVGATAAVRLNFSCVFYEDRRAFDALHVDALRPEHMTRQGVALVRGNSGHAAGWREPPGSLLSAVHCDIPKHIRVRTFVLQQRTFVSVLLHNRHRTALHQVELLPPPRLEARASSDAPPSDVCLVVPLQDVETLVVPFVEHHLASGVGHVLLYDLGSTDETLQRAARVAQRHATRLHVLDWSAAVRPHTKRTWQVGAALVHAVARFGVDGECRWFAQLAVEEFLLARGSISAALAPFARQPVLSFGGHWYGAPALLYLVASFADQRERLLPPEVPLPLRFVLRERASRKARQHRRLFFQPRLLLADDDAAPAFVLPSPSTLARHHDQATPESMLAFAHFEWQRATPDATYYDRTLAVTIGEHLADVVPPEALRRSQHSGGWYQTPPEEVEAVAREQEELDMETALNDAAAPDGALQQVVETESKAATTVPEITTTITTTTTTTTTTTMIVTTTTMQPPPTSTRFSSTLPDLYTTFSSNVSESFSANLPQLRAMLNGAFLSPQLFPANCSLHSEASRCSWFVRRQLRGAKFDAPMPEERVARAEGLLLASAVPLARVPRGLDLEILMRYRLWTFWDVFIDVASWNIVLFGDKHPEYSDQQHFFACTLRWLSSDGEPRTHTGAATFTQWTNVPNTNVYCALPRSLVAALRAGRAGAMALSLDSVQDNIHITNLLVPPPLEARAPLYLSMWTMLLNQETLIVPWIEYNLMMGVQHFFLYDNNCTDMTIARVAPYVQRGIATVIDWSIEPRHQHSSAVAWPIIQINAMNHFLQKYGRFSRWVAMFDTDEYILPRHDSTLRPILQRHDAESDERQLGALGVRCMFYGGGRSKSLPEGLLPELYTEREAQVEQQGYEKLIVRPERVQRRVNIHGLVREPLLLLNESEVIFNHYWWQRPRLHSDTPDTELMDRFGSALKARVPPESLKRSPLAKRQLFSFQAKPQ